VLELADDVFVVNSFSKYFNMTGWRLGWIVASRNLRFGRSKSSRRTHSFVPPPRRSTRRSRHFGRNLRVLEERRREFRRRRDYMYPASAIWDFEFP